MVPSLQVFILHSSRIHIYNVIQNPLRVLIQENSQQSPREKTHIRLQHSTLLRELDRPRCPSPPRADIQHRGPNQLTWSIICCRPWLKGRRPMPVTPSCASGKETGPMRGAIPNCFTMEYAMRVTFLRSSWAPGMQGQERGILMCTGVPGPQTSSESVDWQGTFVNTSCLGTSACRHGDIAPCYCPLKEKLFCGTGV